MNDQTQRGVQIAKMYLKDCSVESPNSPAVFQISGAESKFNIDLDVGHTKLDDHSWEVVVTLRTTAVAEERTLFLVEVKQAAVVQATGLEEKEYEDFLGIWAPTQIYPYAREVVTTLTAHAGFPPLLLPIVNFEQYQLQRKQRAAGAQAAAPEPTVQ